MIRFILFIFIINISLAQVQIDNNNKLKSAERLNEFLDKEKKADTITIKQLQPVNPPLLQDSIINSKYKEALEGYYNYQTHGYIHRQNVFEWQLFSSKVIFIVVILLVFAGIYFSGVQFHKSLIEPISKNSSETNASITTQLEASFQSIKINSPVLGVIILIISLLFFYLYLVYVYPITEIF